MNKYRIIIINTEYNSYIVYANSEKEAIDKVETKSDDYIEITLIKS